MNLTRDDLIHNVDVTTTHAVYQTKKHAERYPDGVFVDKTYATLGIGGRIRIRRAELTRAMESVDGFCRWLEEIRNDYSAYRKYTPEGKTPRRRMQWKNSLPLSRRQCRIYNHHCSVIMRCL